MECLWEGTRGKRIARRILVGDETRGEVDGGIGETVSFLVKLSCKNGEDKEGTREVD